MFHQHNPGRPAKPPPDINCQAVYLKAIFQDYAGETKELAAHVNGYAITLTLAAGTRGVTLTASTIIRGTALPTNITGTTYRTA
ncbi:MAG: hypothetical protein V4577_09875 [Bacteroidota bacterium]